MLKTKDDAELIACMNFLAFSMDALPDRRDHAQSYTYVVDKTYLLEDMPSSIYQTSGV
jgi:hypothetical protein